MAKKEDLTDWLLEALNAHNRSASIVDVCKYVCGKY